MYIGRLMVQRPFMYECGAAKATVWKSSRGGSSIAYVIFQFFHVCTIARLNTWALLEDTADTAMTIRDKGVSIERDTEERRDQLLLLYSPVICEEFYIRSKNVVIWERLQQKTRSLRR